MTSKSKQTPSALGAVCWAAGAALVGLAVAVELSRTRGPLPPVSVTVDVPQRPALPAHTSQSSSRAARFAPAGIAAALLLGSVGAGFVGIAVASQRSPAPAPIAAPEPVVVLGRDVEAWQADPAPLPDASEAAVAPAEVTPAVTQPAVMTRSLPVSLHIPAIEVRSTLLHLGQAGDGSVETPRPGPSYNDAAWYRHSPTPGSRGPAILLGHVDSAAEGPSVFFRLGELTAGDRVAVRRADGTVAEFRVDRVRRYAKTEFPTNLVYGNIDHAGLRLVTCGGAFDNSTGRYLDNVVVFASLQR